MEMCIKCYIIYSKAYCSALWDCLQLSTIWGMIFVSWSDVVQNKLSDTKYIINEVIS